MVSWGLGNKFIFSADIVQEGVVWLHEWEQRMLQDSDKCHYLVSEIHGQIQKLVPVFPMIGTFGTLVCHLNGD